MLDASKSTHSGKLGNMVLISSALFTTGHKLFSGSAPDGADVAGKKLVTGCWNRRC